MPTSIITSILGTLTPLHAFGDAASGPFGTYFRLLDLFLHAMALAARIAGELVDAFSTVAG